jgi:hypothetical protein
MSQTLTKGSIPALPHALFLLFPFRLLSAALVEARLGTLTNNRYNTVLLERLQE